MTNEVISFGCRLNIYESEVIKKQALVAGLQDALIFNSCAVTKESERQLRQAIRRKHRQSPEKKIIVTGCAVQIRPEFYAKMPEITQIIGNQEKLESASYSQNEKVLVDDIMQLKETASHMVSSFDGKARAFVQVQNGCNHRCTFCIIPYGRGNSRSVPIGQITEQIKELVNNGFKEVVITGVDITDYGLDLPGKPRLGQMLRRLLNLVPDLPRLRLSSVDVAEIDDDLLELIKNEPRLMPHFHISLQAGDDMILKRMKRRHKRQDVIDFCNQVRQYRPNASFGADIIAGFPTETDEMFENSKLLIKEAGLSLLHVFPYSAREGTPAARIPDDKQIPKEIRKARAKILRLAGMQELQKYQQSFIGKTLLIIVETDEIGRSEEFLKVQVDKKSPAGEIVQVKIINVENDTLVGELI
jgi:threonylcarbamoyladenosine tRNA methylthiotransferase MtaB